MIHATRMIPVYVLCPSITAHRQRHAVEPVFLFCFAHWSARVLCRVSLLSGRRRHFPLKAFFCFFFVRAAPWRTLRQTGPLSRLSPRATTVSNHTYYSYDIIIVICDSS